MSIDPAVVIITILNVVIFFLFLRKKLFVPVTEFMNKRTQTIEGQIAKAEAMTKQAEAMKTQYEAQLLEAEAEGKRIVQEYKDKAQSLSDEILKEANKEAELVRIRAKSDAEKEKEKVNDEIRKQVVTLALLAASKAVEVQMDTNNQHKLIQQFISKVGQ